MIYIVYNTPVIPVLISGLHFARIVSIVKCESRNQHDTSIYKSCKLTCVLILCLFRVYRFTVPLFRPTCYTFFSFDSNIQCIV